MTTGPNHKRDRAKRISKFLSLVLRHDPGKIGISLDPSGWTSVEALLDAMAKHRTPVSLAELKEVVANNDKQRFAFSEDGTRIRASQGHSVEVELGYEPATPPPQLFHGTAYANVDSIRRTGLLRGKRHHVHLSPDEDTATRVGQRHGRPVVLTIRAEDMHRAGIPFFLSANGVWLVETVPPQWIEFP